MRTGDSGGDRHAAPLEELQGAFRTAYRRQKEDTIGALRRGDPPVVMRASDEELLLIGPAGTERFDLDTVAYDTMKQLSHIAPLAALLLDEQEQPRDERHAIDRALENLDRSAPADESVTIVAATRELLGNVDSGSGQREALLSRYRETVRPALEHAARKAAQADLDALARAMRQVEVRLGERGLTRAFLVICGGHQSRRHELTGQFFRRWLGASLADARAEPHRILYAEHRDSVEEVLELVATRIVDARIAERLFCDPSRLDEDILGETARELLAAAASVREFGS